MDATDLEWTDATSYSQGERGKAAPTIWTAKLGPLDLTVHRLHGIEGMWYGTCHRLEIERRDLSPDLDEAKAQILALARRRVDQYAAALGVHQPPILADLCEALGWQGGTVHDAVAEVRTMRHRLGVEAQNLMVIDTPEDRADLAEVLRTIAEALETCATEDTIRSGLHSAEADGHAVFRVNLEIERKDRRR